MPPKGIGLRSQQLSYLSTLSHSILTRPEIPSLLKEAEQEILKAIELSPQNEEYLVELGNLYLRVTKEQLKILCSKYGTVKNVEFVFGSGFAYVEMETEEAADKIVQELDGAEFMERVLSVKKRAFAQQT